MNLADFIDVVDGLFAECRDTLNVANNEYATEVNKFNNFHVTAMICREMNPRLKDIEGEDIAFIFLMKHLFSIAAGISIREPMRGRYKDLINYIFIHFGITEEKRLDDSRCIEVEDHHPGDGVGPSPDVVSEEAMIAMLRMQAIKHGFDGDFFEKEFRALMEGFKRAREKRDAEKSQCPLGSPGVSPVEE